MTRMIQCAAIPLGPAGAITEIGLLMAPLVVLSVKPVMLFEPLFDTKRNWPV